MSITEEISNKRKQAFYDSNTDYRANIAKYRNITDPILQQKDRYVSQKNTYYIIYNILQKENYISNEQDDSDLFEGNNNNEINSHVNDINIEENEEKIKTENVKTCGDILSKN